MKSKQTVNTFHIKWFNSVHHQQRKHYTQHTINYHINPHMQILTSSGCKNVTTLFIVVYTHLYVYLPSQIYVATYVLLALKLHIFKSLPTKPINDRNDNDSVVYSWPCWLFGFLYRYLYVLRSRKRARSLNIWRSAECHGRLDVANTHIHIRGLV